MLEDEPSHTAIYVAVTRAAHLRYDPPPHLLDDSVAADLLGPEHADKIADLGDGAHWVLRENRLFVPLRARWVEDRLLDAFARGIRRFLILGAGLDSFAFRRPPGLEELEIIEIDHPATQRWKRERIESLGWPVPANLRFVECDFERTSVSQALADAGIQTGVPTFVSWMGVIYYLQRPTARNALAELSSLLGPGSEVALDFMLPLEDLSQRYVDLRKTIEPYLAQVGEPHVNRLRAHELEDDVATAGFARTILVDRGDLEAAYMANLDTDVPLSERFGLAIAAK